MNYFQDGEVQFYEYFIPRCSFFHTSILRIVQRVPFLFNHISSYQFLYLCILFVLIYRTSIFIRLLSSLLSLRSVKLLNHVLFFPPRKDDEYYGGTGQEIYQSLEANQRGGPLMPEGSYFHTAIRCKSKLLLPFTIKKV